MTQMVKYPPAMQETQVDPWVGKISWRMEWIPTPVFFPGEFHGQRSLVGYGLLGRKELDTTEWLTYTHTPYDKYTYNMLDTFPKYTLVIFNPHDNLIRKILFSFCWSLELLHGPGTGR